MNLYSIKVSYYNKKEETFEIEAEGSIQAVRSLMEDLELNEIDENGNYGSTNIERIDVFRLK